MDLAHHAANTWAIASDNNEKVLGNESHLFIYPHDLNVSESLTVRTHFVLAFYDKDTLFFQSAIRLTTSVSV
jgi:hypothetical protein